MQHKQCRICKSKQLKKIFSLGKQPIANNLLTKKGRTETYPLDLYRCEHCSLIQLGYIVDKRKLYDKYFYVPSTSQTHLEHFKLLASRLIKELSLKEKDLVIDIGSSDGSLLKEFEKKGMSVSGVEPAKNIESSVPTLRKYFNKETAKIIVKNVGHAKLVTATNSFAHIDNLGEYLEALNIVLAQDGVFYAQFPDVRNLLIENQFDTIYHEHLSYFTYEPLHHLFATSPFEMFRVDSSKIHGGSMGVYIRRRKPLLQDFVSNVQKIKKDLRSVLLAQKKLGKKIVGFGAAAKGMVLLNYCHLDNTIIDYIADGTSYKQGKYAPGVNIPIVSEDELKENKPDIVIILAWNFKDEIMEKLKGRGYTFIVPIPTVQIFSSEEIKNANRKHI